MRHLANFAKDILITPKRNESLWIPAYSQQVICILKLTSTVNTFIYQLLTSRVTSIFK